MDRLENRQYIAHGHFAATIAESIKNDHQKRQYSKADDPYDIWSGQ